VTVVLEKVLTELKRLCRVGMPRLTFSGRWYISFTFLACGRVVSC
jgi:hypothetical protein